MVDDMRNIDYWLINQSSLTRMTYNLFNEVDNLSWAEIMTHYYIKSSESGRVFQTSTQIQVRSLVGSRKKVYLFLNLDFSFHIFLEAPHDWMRIRWEIWYNPFLSPLRGVYWALCKFSLLAIERFVAVCLYGEKDCGTSSHQWLCVSMCSEAWD